MSRRQELIDAIEQKVAQTQGVIDSAVALIMGFVEAVREARDDEEELEAVLGTIEAQVNALSQAVVAGTEEPAQTGGEDSGDAPVGAESTVSGGEGADDLGGEPSEPASEDGEQ